MSPPIPSTPTIQVLIFVSRNPRLTPSQFYTHWSTVHAPLVAPWAQKHDIVSYRQIHKSGFIVPNLSDRELPSALSSDGSRKECPTTPQPYDGIAIFEASSDEDFQKAFQDEYYKSIIEPDEHNMIDKNGFAGGIVATFSGPMVTVVGGGEVNIEGNHVDERRAEWEKFEEKARTR